MAKNGTLTVRLIGDAKPLDKTLNNVEGKLSKFGSSAVKVGKVAAVGTAAAAAGAVALGNEVLNTGAKLTTWRLKTATVFEDSADDIRQWADKNNEVFGVTDDQLAGLAASFGDLLKPMGFTADEAAAMSKDVVGLSGALSEWTGGQRSAAEVSDILAKAMLGERESLKELGISITEADVQQRLLEKGQKDLTGAALQQAKALATQELIFEKSTDAQTAFAEGGNKALRAQNGLRAGLAELREQVADRLLPVVTSITQYLADKLPPAMERAGQIASDLKARWDSVFPAIQAVVETFGAVVSAVVDTVIGLFKKSEGDVGGSASKLSKIISQLGELFGSVFAAIKTVVETTVAVVTVLWETFGDTILKYATETFKNIQTVISGALDVIIGLVEVFIAVLTGDWRAAWDGIKQILSGVLEIMRGLVAQALDALTYIIGLALAAIGLAWREGWNAIKSFLSDTWEAIKNTAALALFSLVQFFTDLPGRIIEAVKAGAEFLWDLGRWVVRQILNGVIALADATNGIKGWFNGLPQRVLDWVLENAGKLVDLGKQMIDKIISGITSNSGGIKNAIISAIPGGGILRDILPGGDGPGAPPGGGGSTLSRIRGALTPGTYVTSTYRDPAHNRRVGGSPTSYHMDRSNPAVDIGGSTAALDQLYRRLKAMGGWRELIWRAPGHYDHIHVAHAGSTFRADRPGGEGLALLRDGERVSTPTEPASGGFRDPERDGVLMARAFSAEMRRLARAG